VSPRPSGWALLLAAGGGALCFLGFVGFGLWPLSLVCLVPLWLAVEEPEPIAPLRAALLGFVYGAVAYAGGFHWMWRIVDVFLGGDDLLGALLWCADASWFGLRFALVACLYALVRRSGASTSVAGVASLLAVEWLYPTLFPVYLGHALASHVVVIQISDLGGPLLLSAFLALVNAAAVETLQWMRRRRRVPLRSWGGASLTALLVWTYGTLRIPAIDLEIAAAPRLRVGIVQGNLGVFEKGRRAELDHRAYLEQTRELLASGDVDLVVWPETVYTRGLLRPLPLSGRLIRDDLEVPLLFGAATVSGDGGHRRNHNSALLIDADGVIRDVYDKNDLIPFTEHLPFAELLPARFAGASEFSPGVDRGALSLGPWRISTPICHEVLQATLVRRMVLEADPHLLATLANDSWFGDSQAPWMHLALARLRAVEHRRYLVRATNSGVSAVVDPVGRDVARSGLLTRENVRATVGLLEGTTVYTRWGDWPGWLAVAVCAAAIPPRSRRR